MESVNDGSLPSIFLLQLLSLKIIQYSSLIIPISLFFGVLVSLNRFYITNEMVIMKLGGYSSRLISNVLSKIIIGTSIIVMLFNFFITPYAIDNRLKIEHQVLHEQKIYTLAEGRFNYSTDNSKVVYISNKNKSEPGNIFIKSKNDDSTRIDISSRIIPSEDAVVYLKDGINYIFNSENGLSSTSYNEQNFLLSNIIPNKVNNNIKAKSIIELFASDNTSALIEALQRISMIIATFVLGYLAIPLSHTNEREDKYKNIFIGILFYFSYIILINLLSNYFSNISYAIVGLVNLHLLFAYITYQLFKYSQR
jgi:lipopolysaccharide export system permease protein